MGGVNENGTRHGNGRLRFEPQISIGNLLSILTMLVIGLGAFYAVQADGKAHAQRLDQVEKKIEQGDRRDDETTRSLGDLKGAVIELRSDLKAQARQLERIEQLLQQQKRNP